MRDHMPVQAGEVWESTDRREQRRVRVVAVGEWPGYATVVPVDARGDDLPGGRRSRIKLDGRGWLSRYRRLR